MNMFIMPIFTIIAGLAILVFPRLLSYIVAFYLILIGILEIIVYMN